MLLFWVAFSWKIMEKRISKSSALKEKNPRKRAGYLQAMNFCGVILLIRDNFLFSFLQYTANSLGTPKRCYPSLAGGLRRYFKAHHGQNNSFSRQPLFPQDVEHLIDTCGVNTPKQLQSKYWLKFPLFFSTIVKCYCLSSISVF